MVRVIACLSSYDEQTVRELAGTNDVEVRLRDSSRGQEQVPELVADALIVIGDPALRYLLDRAAIDAMQRCILIEQPSAGLDSVDLDAAADRGIPVANTAGFNAGAVADWVLMAVLTMLRDPAAVDASVRAGRWDRPPLGRELGSLTVGIVGMGHIGGAVAQRVAGFGSQVLFCGRRAHRISGALQVTLHELLARSDVVSLHLPLTPRTRGLIGAAELDRMRDRSLLVNSSRGAIVDEQALIAALRRGRPAMAALDVFGTEPVPTDSALLSLPQVLLSPHVATRTEQARDRQREMVATNIRRVLAGQCPEHLVGPPADDTRVLRAGGPTPALRFTEKSTSVMGGSW